jgi:hypothetical protein
VNFSLAVKLSFYIPASSFHPKMEEIIKNLTDCVLGGFVAVLPDHSNLGLALPSSMATQFVTSGISSTDGYIVLNCSAYIASFNTSNADSIFLPPAIASWKSSSIQLFQSRATSPEIAEIVTASTFHVLLLTCHLSLLTSHLPYMFDHSFPALPIAAFTRHPSISNHPEIAAPHRF